MTPPLFLATSLVDARPGSRLALEGDEARHAVSVRRVRVGERLWIGDGRGRICEGPVDSIGRHALSLLVDVVRDEPEPAARIVVVQALARGGRDETAVETMTELGVDEVIGWEAARSIARWSDRTLSRWQATARAATKQSRRAWLPGVSGPATTAQVRARIADAALAVVLDGCAEAPIGQLSLAPGETVLVVGPEGGFAETELTAFADAGAVTARLGPNVLRSSTAGAAAISALSATSRWS